MEENTHCTWYPSVHSLCSPFVKNYCSLSTNVDRKKLKYRLFPISFCLSVCLSLVPSLITPLIGYILLQASKRTQHIF